MNRDSGGWTVQFLIYPSFTLFLHQPFRVGLERCIDLPKIFQLPTMFSGKFYLELYIPNQNWHWHEYWELLLAEPAGVKVWIQPPKGRPVRTAHGPPLEINHIYTSCFRNIRKLIFIRETHQNRKESNNHNSYSRGDTEPWLTLRS